MKKHLLRGKKFNSSHSSVIDAAIAVVELAKDQPEVSKISLGMIRSGLPPGKHKIKLLPIQGGWKVQVRGSTSVQDLYVYTSSPEKTQKTLQSLNEQA